MQFMDATARRRGSVPGGRDGIYFLGFAVSVLAGFAATFDDLWTLLFFVGAAVVVAATAGAAMTLSAIAEAITRFMNKDLRGKWLGIERDSELRIPPSQRRVTRMKCCSSALRCAGARATLGRE